MYHEGVQGAAKGERCGGPTKGAGEGVGHKGGGEERDPEPNVHVSCEATAGCGGGCGDTERHVSFGNTDAGRANVARCIGQLPKGTPGLGAKQEGEA